MLAYAEQEAFEMEVALKEAQIQSHRSQIILIALILSLCLLLLVILYGYNRRLQKKNHNLYLRIKEQDIATARYEELLPRENISLPADEQKEDHNKRILYIRLNEYLLTDRNFACPEIDVNMLITALSTNRTYLFEVIKIFTGKTLQEYINYLRG